LVQAAWGLTRSKNGGVLGRKYEKWVASKGKSKAVVALARKMIETMWVLATREELYLDYDPVKFKQKLVKYEVNFCGVAGAA
jgi:hypothetical protein